MKMVKCVECAKTLSLALWAPTAVVALFAVTYLGERFLYIAPLFDSLRSMFLLAVVAYVAAAGVLWFQNRQRMEAIWAIIVGCAVFAVVGGV